VFEEKQEKSEDAQWAKSLFDPLIHNSLPASVNKKVFEFLDYKDSNAFFSRLHRHVKELFEVAKGIKTSTLSPTLLPKKIAAMTDDKPCSLARLLWEKNIFPE